MHSDLDEAELSPHCPRHVSHLNDDTLGRAWALLLGDQFSLIAATAATRLGLAPPFTHLASTSFHVDGRYNSDEELGEHVIHITRGSSRDHRPDLNQVMLDLIVEPQAQYSRADETPPWEL
jgi:transposase